MATIRKAKRNKFSSISNRLLQDSSISFGCRGLLSYLLSKPDDWQCRVSDIEREGGIGVTARRSLMIEAEKAGYLTYHRARDEKGRFADSYMVHEEPVKQDQRTASWTLGTAPADEQDTDEPGAGFQGSVNQSAEKQGGTNNTELQKTDIQKTEKPIAPNGAANLRLMKFLSTLCGKIPDGKAQGGAINWLMDAGYTVEQCEGCLLHLSKQDWRDTSVSWLTVKKEIGAWVKKNPNVEPTEKKEARVEYQKKIDGFRQHLGCPNCETVLGLGNYPFSRGYLSYPYGKVDAVSCPECNPKNEQHFLHSQYVEVVNQFASV